MTNENTKKTEQLLEKFKWYSLNYKLLTEMLTDAMKKLQHNKRRDSETIGTASVLIHALLDPTNDFIENEVPQLKNNLENIYEDEKENYLKLVEGKLSTLNALLMLFDDNVKKLHIQMLEEEEE